MEDCLFCKIIKGEIPSKKVYENEYVYAFDDINPWDRSNTTSYLEIYDINTKESFDCLLTCTPYGNIEEWLDSKGNKITSDMCCDMWIDRLLENFQCKRYVFVTDGNITKYKPYVVEELDNTSHFGKNSEYVVVIDNEI